MKGQYALSAINADELDDPVAIFTDLISHHAPHAQYLFGWVDCARGQQFVQMVHDIELADGRVIENCFPHANCWYSLYNGETYATPLVTRVRLAKLQPPMVGAWQYRGASGALDKPDY